MLESLFNKITDFWGIAKNSLFTERLVLGRASKPSGLFIFKGSIVA